MYSYLILKDITEIPKIIDNKKVIIERSRDKQLTNYDKELVVRVNYNNEYIFLTTMLFKTK